ncbi:PREDICTED: LOW QUALITY PROTEIN: uncharacterized protein LOC104815118 [Tarenaya hassleriana]|uniref:LOW QUALITY PROTEIN: uncharacterized protein LOC104815118 n=1 Tax=Tarenaya hassleriana TaxID=28532 RepID=UPI00053C16BD|nr:PREDICTED: LOW QUALITY PROTEIN: uncharacterized protein LOC104815118 [Tarenaya hassleriana]
MATEPLTNEAIALTEKKVDMALDEIIKMSKSNVNKGKKQRRAPNKSQNSSNGAVNGRYNNALKVRRYMESRSAVRQGAFAKRRTNFQGNQFPVAFNAARKAANALPWRGRPVNAGRTANANQSRFVAPAGQIAKGYYNDNGNGKQKQEKRGEEMERRQGSGGGQRQTLDSLFANMKEERMRSLSQQRPQQRSNGTFGVKQRVPYGRRWGN